MAHNAAMRRQHRHGETALLNAVLLPLDLLVRISAKSLLSTEHPLPGRLHALPVDRPRVVQVIFVVVVDEVFGRSLGPIRLRVGHFSVRISDSGRSIEFRRLIPERRLLTCEARPEIGEGRPKELMDDASRLLVRYQMIEAHSTGVNVKHAGPTVITFAASLAWAA